MAARQFREQPENLLTGGAIAVFVAAEVLNVFGWVSVDTVLQATLGALALMATGSLVERARYLRKLDRTSDETLRLVRGLWQPTSAEDFFRRRDQRVPLEDLIGSARDVYVAGQVLAELIGLFTPYWVERINAGMTLRVAVPESTQANFEGITRIIADITDAEAARHQLSVTMGRLDNLRAAATGSGSIEVRQLGYVPSVSFIVVDGATNDGHMQIEVVPYRAAMRARPHFLLTRRRDGYWYDMFHARFEAMWDEAPQGTKRP